MALSDRLSMPEGQPEPKNRSPFPVGAAYEGGQAVSATVNVSEVPEDEWGWREAIRQATNLTVPSDRRVELVETRLWEMWGVQHTWCKFRIEARPDESSVDLESLITAAKKARATKASQETPSDYGLVVAWADLQVGKTGARGGSAELVERVEAKIAAVEERAKRLKPGVIHLIDVGDCVESFENTGEQGFTNDLSFPDQLRVARRLMIEAVIRWSKWTPEMVISSVPSNHGRWRRSKDALGRPGDDFGLETLAAVYDACQVNPEALGHVRAVMPSKWEETLALDIAGTRLAVAHGHQATKPDGIPDWWSKQVHGGQPSADADILLTGHFHSLRVQTTGRSPHTGRAKWWIQAPTVDNGSDWFRFKAGSDSDPGMLTFVVDADGWREMRVL